MGFAPKNNNNNNKNLLEQLFLRVQTENDSLIYILFHRKNLVKQVWDDMSVSKW